MRESGAILNSRFPTLILSDSFPSLIITRITNDDIIVLQTHQTQQEHTDDVSIIPVDYLPSQAGGNKSDNTNLFDSRAPQSIHLHDKIHFNYLFFHNFKYHPSQLISKFSSNAITNHDS